MEKKRALMVALFAGAFLIQGCSSDKVWFNPNKSSQETIVDEANCRIMARQLSPNNVIVGRASTVLLGAMIDNNRVKAIYNDCMTAKGYSLVNKNSPLLMSVGIPIANMTTEQCKAAYDKMEAKAESGDAGAQYQLGCLYYNGDFGVTKNFTEAIKWYQQAADQNYPNVQLPLASAYTQRGVLERRTGDLNGALADFNKAIEIKPDFNKAYYARGYVKQCIGDIDGAFIDYNKFIDMNPSLGVGYSMRGLLNYNLHKFTEALVDFRKSCVLNADAKIQDYSRCYIWFIRARLGEQDSATKELQAYLNNRKTGTSNKWSPNIARLLTGELTEPDFFKAAENSDQQTNKKLLCEAYFYAGSKRLVEGDKTTATDYFKKCLATECKEFDEYHSAAAELKSLETSK